MALREDLRATEAWAAFAWLPPSSLHMTLFDGLLHDRREQGFWPLDLAGDADAGAADAFMLEQLARVAPPGAGLLAEVRGAHGLEGGGLGLSVVPSDEAGVRGYRDRVAAAVGLLERPGHGSYPFHITLAYQIAWPELAASEAFNAVLEAGLADLIATGPIALGPGEVCLFDDMTHFAPQVT